MGNNNTEARLEDRCARLEKDLQRTKMSENLNQKDYFDLEHIKREVYDLIICSLDLASIVDQPIDKDGLISVRFTYAAELIHNTQLAARELTLSFDQINDYLDALRNKIEK